MNVCMLASSLLSPYITILQRSIKIPHFSLFLSICMLKRFKIQRDDLNVLFMLTSGTLSFVQLDCRRGGGGGGGVFACEPHDLEFQSRPGFNKTGKVISRAIQQ